MIRRFRTPDGLELAFRDEGSRASPGLAALCLAGLTRNMHDFDALAARLSASRRVIRLDARGRGLSDHDSDWSNYNVVREAQDALALMDHLDLTRTVVIGTSRGGLTAMMMAAIATGRVAGALLNDVGPVIDPEGLARIFAYLGTDPGFPDYETAAKAVAAAQAARFPGVPLAVWRDHVQRSYAEGPEGLVLNYDPHLRDAMLAQAEAAIDKPPDLWPLFDALAGVPVTVLRGEHSDLLTAETVAAMKARKSDLDVVEVPARGHVPFLDEPESLAAITRLLERVDRT